jgi:hypothetical protein
MKIYNIDCRRSKCKSQFGLHINTFVSSELDGGEWRASRPGHFTPERNRPSVPIGQEVKWALELF